MTYNYNKNGGLLVAEGGFRIKPVRSIFHEMKKVVERHWQLLFVTKVGRPKLATFCSYI